MKVKVIKVGDDLAFRLPNEIVKMLDLEEGQELFARRLPEGGVCVGHSDPVFDKGMRIAKEAMVKYAETFKALAKT